MKKADPENPKLTENDRVVLRKIIEHAKIPDSAIAHEMGISPQAVFKIRTKLEELGIIKSYSPIINYKKVGIKLMSFIVINVKPSVWAHYSDKVVSDRLSKIPCVISAYRVADAHASHILLIGSRDEQQRERYLTQLQTKHTNEIEIKEVYTFLVENVIVQNSIGILNEVLEKSEITNYELFPLKNK